MYDFTKAVSMSSCGSLIEDSFPFWYVTLVSVRSFLICGESVKNSDTCSRNSGPIETYDFRIIDRESPFWILIDSIFLISSYVYDLPLMINGNSSVNDVVKEGAHLEPQTLLPPLDATPLLPAENVDAVFVQITKSSPLSILHAVVPTFVGFVKSSQVVDSKISVPSNSVISPSEPAAPGSTIFTGALKLNLPLGFPNSTETVGVKIKLVMVFGVGTVSSPVHVPAADEICTLDGKTTSATVESSVTCEVSVTVPWSFA